VTAAFALPASTHGVLVLLTHAWSNRPSRNFRVRMRVTASSMRLCEMAPDATSCRMAACHWSGPNTSMLMSTPALTDLAMAPARSGVTWYALCTAGTSW
jgi:hypothetical protein